MDEQNLDLSSESWMHADRRLSRTDFWGPASNFGIPIAAVMDTQKDPEMCAISPLPLKQNCTPACIVLDIQEIKSFG